MRKNNNSKISKKLCVSFVSLLTAGIISTAAFAQSYPVSDGMSQRVFPGDSITGIVSAVFKADGAGAETADGTWNNSTNKVYTAECHDNGNGIEASLEESGYQVSVVNGESGLSDGSDSSERHKAADEAAGSETGAADIAYFFAGESVQVTTQPEAGEVFDHWEGTGKGGQNIIFDNSSAESAAFVMINDSVDISAVYSVKNDPPAQEESQGNQAVPEEKSEYLITNNSPDLLSIDGSVRKEDDGAGNITLYGVPDKYQSLVVSEIPEDFDHIEVLTDTTHEQVEVLDSKDGPNVWTFIMPHDDIHVTIRHVGGEAQNDDPAEAPDQPSDAGPHIITLSDSINTTIDGAEISKTGEMTATEGTVITVVAAQSSGQEFEGFSVKGASGTDIPLSEAGERRYTFSMPAEDISVTANYTSLPMNVVSVKNGDGSGQYVEGDTVQIHATAPGGNNKFKRWEIAAGDIVIADETSPDTSFVMGKEAVAVKAVFGKTKYMLTVNNGEGGGMYEDGESIHIIASMPESGKEFTGWSMTAQTNATAPTKFEDDFVMPEGNVTLEAVYSSGPSASDNKITGVKDGQIYACDEKITFECSGAGMDNNSPNPGDYRYRPSKYSVASFHNQFDEGDYKKSIAISLTGKYAIDVTFAMDVYDGTKWEQMTDSADTRSATIEVKDSLLPEDKDSSEGTTKKNNTLSIISIACTAAALTLLVLLLIIRRRKRK